MDASSGNNVGHRPNTDGNRSLNSVLHIIAVCQIRDGGRGQGYYLRKITDGNRHLRRLMSRTKAGATRWYTGCGPTTGPSTADDC
ncbi:hypothetical protein ABZ478_20025 [Streptomyces sp. NPDC005706]|uniref:hypothetical protein n=1 Tax=Streptomyces sp. NPDC005706 TaxID=3157169 RepID=UPI0033DD15D2